MKGCFPFPPDKVVRAQKITTLFGTKKETDSHAKRSFSQRSAPYCATAEDQQAATERQLAGIFNHSCSWLMRSSFCR
jgi:hypothetical protein